MARRNVRRMASLSGPGGASKTLNLAHAVVEAGREAWSLVAPALEGDAGARRTLRELAAPGLAREARRRTKGTGAGALPPPRCQGTPAQRRHLERLVAFVRATSGCPDALPSDTQLRISRTMTSALGRCTYRGRSRRITIAERLFRPGLEDLLWDTVKHELAHLADQVTRSDGRSDHGRTWKAWARRLDARPERLCGADEARRIDRVVRRASEGPLALPPEVQRWLESGARAE